MNEHLKLVEELHVAMSRPLPSGADKPMSDIEIIGYQALLMEAGATVLQALKVTEIADILSAVVNLAYIAAAATAAQKGQLDVNAVAWRQDGSVLSVMKAVSGQINQCAAGSSEEYAKLYRLCESLARNFLNADFDKAFRLVHGHRLFRLKASGTSWYDFNDRIYKEKLADFPDVSEALFE